MNTVISIGGQNSYTKNQGSSGVLLDYTSTLTPARGM